MPLAHAARSAAPAVFLHGLRDDFIPFSHTQQLYEAYGGQKELITVEADHNGERGGEVVRHVIAFFKRCLRRFRRAFLMWFASLEAPTCPWQAAHECMAAAFGIRCVSTICGLMKVELLGHADMHLGARASAPAIPTLAPSIRKPKA